MRLRRLKTRVAFPCQLKSETTARQQKLVAYDAAQPKNTCCDFLILEPNPMCWVKKRIKGAKNEKEELRGRELWPNSMPSFPWITMVSSSFPLPACDCTLGPIFFPNRISLYQVLRWIFKIFHYFWYLIQYCKCMLPMYKRTPMIHIQFQCRQSYVIKSAP